MTMVIDEKVLEKLLDDIADAWNCRDRHDYNSEYYFKVCNLLADVIDVDEVREII